MSTASRCSFAAVLFTAAITAECAQHRKVGYNEIAMGLRGAWQQVGGHQPRLEHAGGSAAGVYSNCIAGHCFVLNHLAKCGGTTAERLAYFAFNGHHESMQIRSEKEGVHRRDVKHGGFIVGLIRSPFDYYVSLWAYTALRPNGTRFRASLPEEIMSEVYPEPMEGHPLGETQEEVDAFHKWLRAVSVRDLGLLSLRFYAHYLDMDSTEQFRDGAFNMGTVSSVLGGDLSAARAPPFRASGWNKTMATEIRHKLEQPDAKNSTVSCWARTENLIPELEACLHEWEDVASVNGAFLDWVHFRKQAALAGDMNPSEHAPCTAFFGDDPAGRAAAEFVARADGPLMKIFGYQAACFS